MAAQTVIRLPVAADVALSTIRESVGNAGGGWRFFLGDGKDRAFVGYVRGQNFVVRRARFPANANTPLMYGHVTDTADGCEIVARVRFHPLVRAGLSIGLGLVAVLVISTVWAGFQNPLSFYFGAITAALGAIIAMGALAERRRDTVRLNEFLARVTKGLASG